MYFYENIKKIPVFRKYDILLHIDKDNMNYGIKNINRKYNVKITIFIFSFIFFISFLLCCIKLYNTYSERKHASS